MRRLNFTSEEIKELQNLIRQLRRVDADRQKQIRRKLRRIGFHIEDVSQAGDGFTIADFQELIKRGTITVDDGATPGG